MPILTKQSVILVFTLCLSLCLGGCFAAFVPAREKFLAEGRYAEAAQVFEERIKGKELPENADLAGLCLAYAKLKDYDRLFATINRLETNIRASKKTYGQPPFSAMAIPGHFDAYSDVAPLPHIFRAEAYLELGNFPRALEHALKANEAVDVIGRRINRKFIRFAFSTKEPEDSKPGFVSYRVCTP